MACETLGVENILFVKWSEVTETDIPAVLRAAKDLHRDRGEIIYVSIVTEKCPPPEGGTRRALARATTSLLEITSSMHLVIEGPGLTKSAQRAVAAGIFLVSGKGGRRMKVHDSVEDALRSAKDLRGNREDILHRARSANIAA